MQSRPPPPCEDGKTFIKIQPRPAPILLVSRIAWEQPTILPNTHNFNYPFDQDNNLFVVGCVLLLQGWFAPPNWHKSQMQPCSQPILWYWAGCPRLSFPHHYRCYNILNSPHTHTSLLAPICWGGTRVLFRVYNPCLEVGAVIHTASPILWLLH